MHATTNFKWNKQILASHKFTRIPHGAYRSLILYPKWISYYIQKKEINQVLCNTILLSKSSLYINHLVLLTKISSQHWLLPIKKSCYICCPKIIFVGLYGPHMSWCCLSIFIHDIHIWKQLCVLEVSRKDYFSPPFCLTWHNW